MSAVVRLVDRRPHLTGTDLLSRLVPPRRFADRLGSPLTCPIPTILPRPRLAPRWSDSPPIGEAGPRHEAVAEGRGRAAGAAARYLDGGYGVGKTHLLAAAWHEAPEPKAYLTFAELAGIIGFLGMDQAIDAFSPHRLLCIDEFELDDIAQTLMTVTFLRAVIAARSEGRRHVELAARSTRGRAVRGG